ncbi:hypothetical protein BKA62DRAFT_777433 [Auriculariales sp. MPI-PUGE-AT-0066]|nr:hypothetical protein BKA62DRAFT_777433 [Auriculariales sp. MPI-PUGE-AT-0066]
MPEVGRAVAVVVLLRVVGVVIFILAVQLAVTILARQCELEHEGVGGRGACHVDKLEARDEVVVDLNDVRDPSSLVLQIVLLGRPEATGVAASEKELRLLRVHVLNRIAGGDCEIWAVPAELMEIRLQLTKVRVVLALDFAHGDVGMLNCEGRRATAS